MVSGVAYCVVQCNGEQDILGGFPKAHARTGVVFTACDPLLRHFSEKPAAVIWSASSLSRMGQLWFLLLHSVHWNIQRKKYGNFRVSMKAIFIPGHSYIRFLHSCFHRLQKYVLWVLAWVEDECYTKERIRSQGSWRTVLVLDKEELGGLCRVMLTGLCNQHRYLEAACLHLHDPTTLTNSSWALWWK